MEVSNDSSLYSGEMAILYCSVRSSPPHTIVKWQKSTNKSQFIDIDLTLNKYGGSTVQSPHLIINSVGLNDKGYYRCGAKNDVGWGHSSPMFLNVIHSKYHVYGTFMGVKFCFFQLKLLYVVYLWVYVCRIIS